jgi:O-methyltransferase domain
MKENIYSCVLVFTINLLRGFAHNTSVRHIKIFLPQKNDCIISKLGNVFNEATASQSKELAKDIVAIYPQIFNGINHLVDVGGGTSTIMKIIADAFPKIKQCLTCLCN